LAICLFQLSFVGLRAAESGLAASGLGGAWVGTYEPKPAEPVFVAVRIDDTKTPPPVVVTIRRKRMIRVPANHVAIDGDQLAFDVVDQGRQFHVDLRRSGDRLDGRIQNLDDSEGAVRLERAVKLTLQEFEPLLGDYRTDQGDLLFVGQGTVNSNRQARFIFVTRGDSFLQLSPVGRDRYLVDNGAQIVFERAKKGLVQRLRWQNSDTTYVVANRVVLWRDEEVSFEGPGAHLSGTLCLPTRKGPHPALVVVHGSGPQTRDDTWAMTDRFARAGIACLAYDKRGSGKSTGDWHNAGFDVLADDVLAAVEFLRGRPDIRSDMIGLWGVSQAGWVIPLAASKSNHIAFCIPVSGAGVCPADQELWRRIQNLQFLGCSSPLTGAMRRGVAMHYQWAELFKKGRFPIPPLFEVEPLDMYHDAAAVIRQVHQPVLAILGDLDSLTPAHESAAIWKRQLASTGNPDFSIRLFPQSDHGLLYTEGSGNNYEVKPESRLAPGYMQCMLDWIDEHARGARVHNVVDAAREPLIKSGGMHELPWYGSAPLQVALLTMGTIGSVLIIVAWPMASVVRKIRKLPRNAQIPRRQIVTAWIANLTALAMGVALVAILRFLSDAAPSRYYAWVEIAWWTLAALTLPIACFAVLTIRAGIRMRRRAPLPGWRQISHWVTATTACSWTLFFTYWTWCSLLRF
jgi:dienelactone hydrolase